MEQTSASEDQLPKRAMTPSLTKEKMLCMMILLLAPLTARLHKLRAPTADGILLMMTTARETMLLETSVATSVEVAAPSEAAHGQAHTGEQYSRTEWPKRPLDNEIICD